MTGLREPAGTVRRLPADWAGLALALVLAGMAGGCAGGSQASSKKAVPGAPNTIPPQWLRTELHLVAVGADDWEAFLAERVTPRFPGGFTVLEALGQWRPPQGEVRRLATKVLVILHPPTSEAEQAIEAIRREYCEAFALQTVLRSTTPALVSF
jgi:hypothetical protein